MIQRMPFTYEPFVGDMLMKMLLVSCAFLRRDVMMDEASL
jgi:hypothetical protein